MIGRRLQSTGNRRRAFTLAEILLTMCLLVILAALAWPALDKPLAGLRLRKAADRIRAEWRTARVEAMDSGQTYIFRYNDQNRFRIEPYLPSQGGFGVAGTGGAATAEDSTLGDALGARADGASDPGTAGTVIEDSLPEGVTFVSSETAGDQRATTISSASEPSDLAEAGWSEPILFYPDGTTSTAQLVLKNEHDRYVDVRMRGLTGVVKVGDVYTAQTTLQ